MNKKARIAWVEAGEDKEARWLSEGRSRPPSRIVPAGDSLRADVAYRHACEGTALLWRGDFRNARQLLTAISRRIDARARRGKKQARAIAPAEEFHRYRIRTATRARVLGMLLIELGVDYTIQARRAPDNARPIPVDEDHMFDGNEE